MTPRTLFTILLKIAGILILADALSIIPQLLLSASTLGESFSDSQSVVVVLFILIMVGMLYLFLCRLFLFKTDLVIDKLSLDKHFKEDRIDVRIDVNIILPIAIIVIGGIVLIDTLPLLCQQIFFYIQSIRSEGTDFNNPNLGWLIFHAAKVLIGYLLISNNRILSTWIESGQKP